MLDSNKNDIEKIEQDDKSLNLSKVTSENLTQNKKLWFLLLIIAALIFIFFVTHKKSQSHNGKASAHSTNNYTASLETNMQALRAFKNRKKSNPSSESNDSEPYRIDSPLEKSTPDPAQVALLEQQLNQQREQQKQELLARKREFDMRLNAPSSFFAAGDAGADNKLLSNLISPQNKIAAIFSEHSMNSEFANQKVDVDTVTATQITHPTATIAQGELIQAILETPINSDLPGMVRAVTNQPVYAYTGNQALIPAGARLIGQYSSGIVQGQSRVMILWNRIILPDGTSAQLHSPGTDDQGISGQGADSINRHFWAQFGEATLLSILGAGAATAGVNGDDQYNSLAYYRSTMAQSLNDTASNVLDKSINIKPTLIIHQGTKINVFVARDLDLDAVVNHD